MAPARQAPVHRPMGCAEQIKIVGGRSSGISLRSLADAKERFNAILNKLHPGSTPIRLGVRRQACLLSWPFSVIEAGLSGEIAV